MDRIVLIDARNLAWRAHWTHHDLSSHKRPTSVIFGFLSMLISIHKKLNAPMIIVWDGKGTTWRHELTKNRKQQYKGNRKHLDKERKSVNQQLPVLLEIMNCLGIINVEVDNMEADDLIGIIATKISKVLKDTESIIYSGDKDFYQLISDKIKVYCAQGRKQGFILTKEKIEKEYGLTPKEFIKMRALCGDKSDHISNVIKGIGSKTAIKLVKDGVDASVKKWNDLPQKVKLKYVFKFSTIWELVKENYALCRIITDENDKRITEEVGNSVRRTLVRLNEVNFRRDKTKLTMQTYQKLLELLCSYQLDEIYSQRHHLRDLL